MHIDIFSHGSQFKITKLIELKDKSCQFFFRPLRDVSEVKERFLNDLSLARCSFYKFQIPVKVFTVF